MEEKTSIKKYNTFNFLLVTILCIIFLTRYLNERIPRQIQVVAVVFLMICSIPNLFSLLRKSFIHFKLISCVFAISSIILLYYILGYSTAASGNYFSQVVFFLCIYIAMISGEYMSQKQKMYFIIALLSVATINLCYNVIINIIYPNASYQTLNLHRGWNSELEGLAIGTTGFNTFTLLFFNICFFLFLNCQSKKYKMTFLILSGLSVYYIYLGQRGSVTLFMVLSIFLLLYTKEKKNIRRRKFIPVVFLILIFIMCIIFSEEILKLLMVIFPSERLQIRFNSLLETLNTGVNEESFTGRYGLYWVSIDSFFSSLKSVLIGIGDHRTEVSNFAATGIGGHSELLDSLARYGLLGFSFITIIYISAYQLTNNFFKGLRGQGQIKYIFLIFILCSMFKVVFTPIIGISIFIMLPFASEILKMDQCYQFTSDR